MKNSSTIAVVLIAILLLGGGYYYMSGERGAPSPETVTTSSPTSDASSAAGGTVLEGSGENVGAADERLAAVQVTYGASGFSPATVTIKRGETVTFTNQSGQKMWVATGPHPAHTGYAGTPLAEHCPDTAGTAFDQCAATDSYSFTFEKAGTWKYHNHYLSSDTGTIIVE